MKTLNFAPLTEVQFQQLAMGKARGFTWTMMADQLSLPLEVVERVPWTHEKQWNRYLTKAERLVAREAIAETVSTLRRDVRNAEPPLHATLANSLTRLLQLQQDFAPARRPAAPRAVSSRPAPDVVPAPVAPPPATPPLNAKPSVGPSLSGTVASLLGFFVLLGALLMGCWNRARGEERPEFIVQEPTPCVVAQDETPDRYAARYLACTVGFGFAPPLRFGEGVGG